MMFRTAKREERLAGLEQEVISLQDVFRKALEQLQHEINERAELSERNRARDAEAYRQTCSLIESECRQEIVKLANKVREQAALLDQIAIQQEEIANLKLAIRGLTNQVTLDAEQNARSVEGLLERLNSK